MNRRIPFVLALVAAAAPTLAAAQDGKDFVAAFVDRNAEGYGEIAQQIWDWAELGYLETRSSELLRRTLADAGFEVEAGVAGIPTAFVASWSNGEGPVIGILAEFDALPGITQDRVPRRAPIEEKPAGHACGHHLFGTGSTAAAVAVKAWMEQSGQRGTIRVYGTPAEEGGAGKV
ncbi:MAG TPA: M20/M25/M40 family metallo-hydrolase, partial [Longimicrobiales bacterium]|nr:M20/M25/M40 family metallo-hydrolase [Longimicrobiales bacterium]